MYLGQNAKSDECFAVNKPICSGIPLWALPERLDSTREAGTFKCSKKHFVPHSLWENNIFIMKVMYYFIVSLSITGLLINKQMFLSFYRSLREKTTKADFLRV